MATQSIIVGRRKTGLIKFNKEKDAEAYIKTKKKSGGINLNIINNKER